MPQHTRHSLINVLLLWTAVLSIVQVAFISFYFYTAGHLGVSPSEHGLLLGKGKMLTFQATDGADAHDDDQRIKWLAKNPDANLISEGDLTVKKDGYYFLNLQVTLCSCDGDKEHTVSLKWNDRLLLHGRIDAMSCGTGLLGKVEELSAGGTLGVTVEPKTCINTSESETHLDIIYMHKP